MIPEWSLIPEREFHWDWKPEWTQWFRNNLYVNKMSFRYHANKYREICGDGMNSFQNYQGSYRFLDPKFKTFSKTTYFFSRLKVIKLVINRDLTKTKEQSFYHDALQTYRRDWIRFDQHEKNFTCKTLALAFKKERKGKTFYHFSRLYLYFPDFFQVWKIAGQISRLY